MTTKEQERQAIEKIRKIVKELGENSYVGFAMEGVLELAEDNIREDTAYSMKKMQRSRGREQTKQRKRVSYLMRNWEQQRKSQKKITRRLQS